MLLALLLLVPAPDLLTVDDDGPADFNSVAEAVAAAAEGDTILVELGTYPEPDFTVDKSLRLVGRVPGPAQAPPAIVAGPFVQHLLSVAGPSSFTVAGLSLGRLEVSDVTGRVRIDECSFAGTVSAVASSQVLMTRCVVAGGPFGINVRGSILALANSQVAGGTAFDGFGEAGVLIRESFPSEPYRDTFAGIAGCSVVGGPGEDFGFGVGWGGNGIYAFLPNSPAGLRVRGSAANIISGGDGFGGIASAIAAEGEFSGVTTVGAVPLAVEIDPPEPFLVIGGDSQLGSTRTIQVSGPAGQPALVFLSLSAIEPVPVPGWESASLWMNPARIAQVKVVALLGQGLPAEVTVPVPTQDGVAEVEVDVQGIVLMSDGSLLLTNPSQILPRR